MTEETAEAIIRTVTGLSVGNADRLEIANAVGENLIRAAAVLGYRGEPFCTFQEHYELKA